MKPWHFNVFAMGVLLGMGVSEIVFGHTSLAISSLLLAAAQVPFVIAGSVNG